VDPIRSSNTVAKNARKSTDCLETLYHGSVKALLCLIFYRTGLTY